MAVFPDKIVLKSSTDGNSTVRQEIAAGQAYEIVPGEIVVSRESSRASLFTLDSNGSVVEIGAGANTNEAATKVRPDLLLNFEGDPGDTPADSSSVQSTYPSTVDKKFGTASLYLNNDAIDVRRDTLFVYSDDMPDLGVYIWTLGFWIKSQPADWYSATYNGISSTFLSVMGPSNYRQGPGAWHIYLDGGTADLGGSGTSTSNASGMAKGAVCLGLGPGHSTGGGYPDGIPATGEIITSGDVTVVDGAWHYVAIQHEGKGVYSIFVDGTLANRTTIPKSINYSDPGAAGIPMPPDLEIGAPGDVLSGTAFIKPGVNGYIDAISLHVGAVLYAGVDTIETPTAAPDNSLQGEGYNYLGALFDVHLTTPVQNQDILAYDAALDRWYNYPAPPVDVSGSSIGDLADVDLTTPPITDQALLYDGTNWVAGDVAANFAELNDVTLRLNSASETSWSLPTGSNYTGGKVTLAPNPSSSLNIAGISAYDNGTVAVSGGSAASLRSTITLFSDESVYFSPDPTSGGLAPANYTIKIETNGTSGQNALYRTEPTLGTGEADLVIPTMGQVRAEVSTRLLTIDSIGDVDTSTTPPGLQQALVWNGTTWVPGNVATGGGGGGGSGSGTVQQETETQTASGGVASLVGIGASGILLDVTSSLDAWITFYPTAAARTADAGRAFAQDPVLGSGVLAEMYVPAGTTVLATPGTNYFNFDDPAADVIYLAVRDQSGVAVDSEITVRAYAHHTFGGLGTNRVTDSGSSNAAGEAVLTGIGQTGQICTITSSSDAWVVMYGSEADRTADAARPFTEAPTPGSGVQVEYSLTAGSTVLTTPRAMYFNNDTSPTDAMYFAVRDQAGNPVVSTLTLTVYAETSYTGISGGTFGSG